MRDDRWSEAPGAVRGTAAIATFFTHREQFHSAMMTPKVSLLEPATRDRLADLQRYFMAHGYPDPTVVAVALLRKGAAAGGAAH